MVFFVSKKMKSWQCCIWRQVSSCGCVWTQRCPDEHRKSCVWAWGVCERRREGDRKEEEHMGRRLGQYIPFSVSRGECQEPDPKSSAMRSLDSIKMLYLYHRYPACYIFYFSLALLPYTSSLLWKPTKPNSPAKLTHVHKNTTYTTTQVH